MTMSSYQISITSFGGRKYVSVLSGLFLKNFFVETASHQSVVGRIYLGKVVRVVTGIDAAFVDIGHERAAFLHQKDIKGEVRAGQSILVQVLKDPIGTKGARLTMDLTLPSTYLVYQPYAEHVGISQKILDNDERLRLQQWLDEKEDRGMIVRTAAEGVGIEDLNRDYDFLLKKWQHIQESAKKNCLNSPQELWRDLSLSLRVIRDFAKLKIDKIFVNCAKTYSEIEVFIKTFFPTLKPVLILESGRKTSLSRFQVANQILQSLSPKLTLSSGGSIVIEQTESMVTVDVNTSGFVGKAGKDSEETILKTNLEAAQMLGRHIPLRELGGVIVIDFIDMVSADHRSQVENALREAFRYDLMPVQILPISSIGLAQMTRKRTTESSFQKFLLECPCCHKGNILVDPQLLLLKALSFFERIEKPEEIALVVIASRPDVLKLFLEEQENWKQYHQLENALWETREIHGVHNELSISVLTQDELK